MKLDDFDYHLPRNLIARYPPPNREDARLLYLPKADETLGHLHITDLPRHLRPGDLIVLNDTKVNPVENSRQAQERRPGGSPLAQTTLSRKISRHAARQPPAGEG